MVVEQQGGAGKRPEPTRLSGAEIDDIRLVFGEANGQVGVRSPHAGIVASGMFERIGRPDELRCGPIYVNNPTHEGSGYEIDDRHLAVVRRLAYVERIVREAHRAAPGSVEVLRLAYVEPRVRPLSAFDVEPGEHGARLSALVAARPAFFAHSLAQLLALSARAAARRVTAAEREALVGVLARAGGLVSTAARAWRAARTGVRRG